MIIIVSGGDIGARDGKLSIMVGGDKNVFEEVIPLLKCMGTNIKYMGKSGSGQHTKMVNQILISTMMVYQWWWYELDRCVWRIDLWL